MCCTLFSAMPVSPEWANLPRRKCDDCGKGYKPTRPRRILNGKQELGFCSDNCRKSYHKHGGAYRKLRAEMRKMVEKELPAIVSAEVERRIALRELCSECKGLGKGHADMLPPDGKPRPGDPTGKYPRARYRPAVSAEDGNCDCRTCYGKKQVLTPFGQDLESFVRLLVEDMTAKGPDD